jgi:hypothetical protein
MVRENLTGRVGLLQFTSPLIAKLLHLGIGRFFVRRNALPKPSLQEEFGQASKQETKKSPHLHSLKLL